MSGPGEQVFDLRPQATTLARSRRGTTAGVFGLLSVIAALGIATVIYGLIAGNALVVVAGVAPAAAGLFVLALFSVVVSRKTIEARVGPGGVEIVPNWGRPVRIAWSDPLIQLVVHDRRMNRFISPLLRDSMGVVASGLFTKRVSIECAEAIFESARAAGLRVTTEDVFIGTRNERRNVTISRTGD